MKETERISALFEALYEGSPWIGITLRGTLEKITPQQAAKRALPGGNAIWEIVNHLISWRLNVLERVQGKTIKTPEHNYMLAVTDVSPLAWKNTLKRLNDTQLQWVAFLKTVNEKDFEKMYLNNGMTYYEHIHGILQHDAYHLGQIALLAKLVS